VSEYIVHRRTPLLWIATVLMDEGTGQVVGEVSARLEANQLLATCHVTWCRSAESLAQCMPKAFSDLPAVTQAGC